MDKQILVSGVRPTGEVHIGNYLGAIKQFVELQDKFKTLFFVADFHALTEPQNPKTFSHETKSVAALYLACGLDPKKTILFVQSHIQEHLELGWLLGTITPVGELNRMTQYKDKVSEGKPANVGLFLYPVAMAADILIYKAEKVPVGEDQYQHLEFARTIARKFNSKFGNTFPEPRAVSAAKGAERLKSIADPSKKMAKSGSPNDYIALLDSETEIRRKIQIAVTDSGKEIKYNPESKPAISNLLTIFSLISSKDIKFLEKEYKDKNYVKFKKDLADLLVEKLLPIQTAYEKIMKDEKKLIKILDEGAKLSRAIAQETMLEVRTKIGLL
ncbi:MAG: tryptophan--tRNA ligase [Patescibacteria group bacterium]